MPTPSTPDPSGPHRADPSATGPYATEPSATDPFATAADPSGTGTVLVTGASGTTGSRVVAGLVAAGAPVRAATRRGTTVAGAESAAFDWYDPDTHPAALDGVDRIYLVAPTGDPEPAAVVRPFLHRARASGVRRAVLLSSSAIASGGPALGQIHLALPEFFEEWAALRPSWFMQNFLHPPHPHAVSIREEGVIRTATGDGRVGFVDADDIAAVAVHTLCTEVGPADEFVITGPEALSHDDLAALFTESTGSRVTHRRLSEAQLAERLAATMPREYAEVLARLDQAIAAGAEDRVTDTVQRLTGRPPRSFRSLLAQQFR